MSLKSEKGEPVQIGTLFKFIKSFDGSREKLNSFLTNCDNAISLASDAQKSILFKYILSQLEGKAETACSIKEFENWDQLSEFLKTQFGERKHYAHLLTDLQECRQLTNEAVNQYALRIETCLSKLLTEVTLSNKKKSELVGRTAAMEDLALHTFLIGLRPNLSNLVRGKNPGNLNEAINIAVSEEKIFNLFYKRNSSTSTQNHVSHRSFQKPNYSFKPAIHNINTKPEILRQSNQRPGNLTCRYCKAEGHSIEVCRKREYNNNRFKVSQNPNPAQQQSYRYNPDYAKPRPARVNYVDDNQFNYCDSENQLNDNVVEIPINSDDSHLNE